MPIKVSIEVHGDSGQERTSSTLYATVVREESVSDYTIIKLYMPEREIRFKTQDLLRAIKV